VTCKTWKHDDVSGEGLLGDMYYGDCSDEEFAVLVSPRWASRNDTSGMVFFKIVLTCGLP
jgi:hypothetical protein